MKAGCPSDEFVWREGVISEEEVPNRVFFAFCATLNEVVGVS